MEENPSALLECLHLEALGVRVSLWDSLVTLGGCHHLDGLEQRGSSSGGSDRRDCEGFLTFPRQRAKRYSSEFSHGLCDPHLVLVVRHPIESCACEAN